MPISTAPYTRKYAHTKSRGSEATVRCDSCGRMVPKYKTFPVMRGFKISDPMVLQQVDRRMIHLMQRKQRFCPACARFRGIIQPGRSIRKKHMTRQPIFRR